MQKEFNIICQQEFVILKIKSKFSLGLSINFFCINFQINIQFDLWFFVGFGLLFLGLRSALLLNQNYFIEIKNEWPYLMKFDARLIYNYNSLSFYSLFLVFQINFLNNLPFVNLQN